MHIAGRSVQCALLIFICACALCELFIGDMDDYVVEALTRYELVVLVPDFKSKYFLFKFYKTES